MKKLFLSLCLAALTPLLFISCASSSATVEPGTNLKAMRTFHVEKVQGDGHDMDQVIAADLRKRGFKATTGPQPRNIDALITYNDKWMWDITMYLLQLDIALRDPKTRGIVGSAKTYRPSLQRKSKEAMATETLDKLFSAQSTN